LVVGEVDDEEDEGGEVGNEDSDVGDWLVVGEVDCMDGENDSEVKEEDEGEVDDTEVGKIGEGDDEGAKVDDKKVK